MRHRRAPRPISREEQAKRIIIAAQKWADSSMFDLWHRDSQSLVEEAVAHSLREPAPDPAKEDWCALASRHLLEGNPPQPTHNH